MYLVFRRRICVFARKTQEKGKEFIVIKKIYEKMIYARGRTRANNKVFPEYALFFSDKVFEGNCRWKVLQVASASAGWSFVNRMKI